MRTQMDPLMRYESINMLQKWIMRSNKFFYKTANICLAYYIVGLSLSSLLWLSVETLVSDILYCRSVLVIFVMVVCMLRHWCLAYYIVGLSLSSLLWLSVETLVSDILYCRSVLVIFVMVVCWDIGVWHIILWVCPCHLCYGCLLRHWFPWNSFCSTWLILLKF